MIINTDRLFLAEVHKRFIEDRVSEVRNKVAGSEEIRNEDNKCEKVENEIVRHEEVRDEELQYEKVGNKKVKNAVGGENSIALLEIIRMNVDSKGNRTCAQVLDENRVRMESEIWQNNSISEFKQWRVILLLFHRMVTNLQRGVLLMLSLSHSSL